MRENITKLVNIKELQTEKESIQKELTIKDKRRQPPSKHFTI